MRKASWIPLALLLVAVAGLSPAAGCRASASRCAVCDRAECRNMVFSIHFSSGKTVETCCPRCGLHFIASQHAPVASLAVRSFDTGSLLDARRAFYVEGSSLTPCSSAKQGLPKDERGCCANPVYDRCLPSLLAFETRSKAESFAREFGGFARVFSELGPTPS